MVAVYRVGLKTKPHLKNSVLRIFHNGAMVLLEFRFARVLGSLPTTQDGLQRVDGICDASLASRDCTLSTGEPVHGAVYWAIALASIVTLGGVGGLVAVR